MDVPTANAAIYLTLALDFDCLMWWKELRWEINIKSGSSHFHLCFEFIKFDASQFHFNLDFTFKSNKSEHQLNMTITSKKPNE